MGSTNLGDRELNPTTVGPPHSLVGQRVESEMEKAWLLQIEARILVVDDDQLIRDQLARLYTQSGYNVTSVVCAEMALDQLALGDTDLVVTAIRLPGMSGVELVKRMQEISPDVAVIVITASKNIETAVEVLKLGASDYIVKPFSAAAIQESTHLVLEKARVFTEIRHLRRTFKDSYDFGGMLSKTPEMHRVFEMIRMVSAMDVTVLVEGETGTGKELVAKAIYHRSHPRDGPFVAINCAGIPETLLESELFGYERGAFTGADQARAGKIEFAHQGTLFLDEIDSMSLSMQAKLLRVLEDKKVQRLGGSRMIQVNMRVIAATNVRLQELVTQGKMRSDFYYRINVIAIKLLPLRQRREDIPLLVHNFLQHHPVAVQKGITKISRRLLAKLMQYSWPGNIRELQNVLEKAVVLTRSRVLEEVDLSDELSLAQGDGEKSSLSLPFSQWIKEQEKQYLVNKLKSNGGSIGLTAKSSGLAVRTLQRKVRTHGLNKKVFEPKSAEASFLPNKKAPPTPPDSKKTNA
jgi:two-component system response regulator HydG